MGKVGHMSKHESWGHYLVHIMFENRLMRTEDEIDRFLFALQNLGQWKSTNHNPSLLEKLFSVLDDETNHIPPMDTLTGLIESYDLELYIKTLLQVTPAQMQQASWWLEHFYARLLNTEEHRLLMQKEYNTLGEDHKRAVETMLRRVVDHCRNDTDQFLKRQRQFRQVTGKNSE
jgi:hypothetical protein